MLIVPSVKTPEKPWLDDSSRYDGHGASFSMWISCEQFNEVKRFKMV